MKNLKTILLCSLVCLMVVTSNICKAEELEEGIYAKLVTDKGFVISITDGQILVTMVIDDDTETKINPHDYGLQPFLCDDGKEYRLGLRGTSHTFENQAVIEADQAMEVIWLEIRLKDVHFIDLK